MPSLSKETQVQRNLDLLRRIAHNLRELASAFNKVGNNSISAQLHGEAHHLTEIHKTLGSVDTKALEDKVKALTDKNSQLEEEVREFHSLLKVSGKDIAALRLEKDRLKSENDHLRERIRGFERMFPNSYLPTSDFPVVPGRIPPVPHPAYQGPTWRVPHDYLKSVQGYSPQELSDVQEESKGLA